jgi:hypothetical protein
MPGASTDFIEAKIPRDGKQPGGEFGGNLIARSRLIDLNKNVLREILGFGQVMEHAKRQVHDRPFVFVHELRKSGLIALFNQQHQDGIGIALRSHKGEFNKHR